MSSLATGAIPLSQLSNREVPTLLFVDGDQQRTIPLTKLPFTVGRRTEKDLVIADPRVSRDHAEITLVGNDHVLTDLSSKHGTFVNGEKIERRKLLHGDRIHFGAPGQCYVVFQLGSTAPSSAAREFLSQIRGIEIRGEASDLEKLTFFLEVARKLNTHGAIEEVLVTLLEATLRITGAERGFVFLRDKEGELKLATGRTSSGQTLTDASSISRSILDETAKAGSRMIVTDTASQADFAARESIVAHDLRTVICMPLARSGVSSKDKPSDPAAPQQRALNGLLYLDSRFASKDLSKLSRDILNTVATEAAALIETAQMAAAEEAARQVQKELALAADIQQRLLTVAIPDVPFAKLTARSIACNEIGGDFIDAVYQDNALVLVIADICGKGVSAAILASILQGMIYAQIAARVSLAEIAASVNAFLCKKGLGEKYATVVIARIEADGTCDLVNCGHVPPVLATQGSVQRLREGNLPVGLIPFAEYKSQRLQLDRGDRLVLVTDGVTEAGNDAGEFFGDDRLEQCIAGGKSLLQEVLAYMGSADRTDDCTIIEVAFQGAAAGETARTSR